MSLVFSDTSTYKGIIQIYEKEIGASQGFISSDITRLKEVTADINLAFDDFLPLAFNSNGLWQFDDSNNTDYPIITTSLVANQRDYAFTTDGSSNLILDVYRVSAKDSSGVFQDLTVVDAQTDRDVQSFYDGRNTTGTPNRYDKTSNAIFLDPIPSYNSSGGLKLYINREPSYFVSTDTTKKPGVPGNLHMWFVLKPAFNYARRNNLAIANSLAAEVAKMEEIIKIQFSMRTRDEKSRMKVIVESNK